MNCPCCSSEVLPANPSFSGIQANQQNAEAARKVSNQHFQSPKTTGSMVGRLVKMAGVSSLGKNRIRENGETWKVIIDRLEGKALGFDAPGNFCIQSLTKPNQVQWVAKNGDLDFKLLEVN